ncbi:MarR family winged helix-turn-helix transcriptional regulator [Nonomuraea sp. NPDC050540]|uniref:MarR family winged helix-turn-helix transcriptional regulator n=1 Tax=Nonomuraea sp. NPDC050540 TaxID=3364367 RepID=UPI00378C9D5E
MGTVDDVDRIIEQWAQERPDLDTQAMEVFGRIYRISQRMGARQEKVHARFGISRGEFDVVATLRRSGEPYQLSPKALAASLMLTSGGMTGRLDRLEKAGLVARSPDPDDRRGLVITLTARGLEVADQAATAGLAAQREVFERLPRREREQLPAMLRDLLALLDG